MPNPQNAGSDSARRGLPLQNSYTRFRTAEQNGNVWRLETSRLDTLTVNGIPLTCLMLVDDRTLAVMDLTLAETVGAEATRMLDRAAQVKGYPSVLRTDGGPSFHSEAFNAWTAANGVEHLIDSAASPMRGGAMEAWDRQMAKGLGAHRFETLDQAQAAVDEWRSTEAGVKGNV